MRLRVTALVLLVGVAVVGCKNNGAGSSADASATPSLATGAVASCDRVQAAGVCSEWTGSYLAQNSAMLSASCARLSGTFATAACPNTTLIGSCTMSTTETRRFYSGAAGSYDLGKAKKECETSLKGKFIADL